MLDLILRRILRSLIVMLCLSIAVFILLHLSGDPTAIMLPPNAPAQQAVQLREALGLDRPLPIQYWRFLTRAIHGQFGTSWQYGLPATKLVIESFPATLQLTICALLISLIVGIPLGLIAAIRERSWVDSLCLSLGVIGRAMPSFWLGIILILIFAVRLHWLPTSGRGGIKHIILPAITLSTAFVSEIVLLVRSGMLEVLREDYIRTARAKGLHAMTVYSRHAFRNTLIPVVTVVGLTFGRLLGGAVIVETVFAWPGVGRLAVQAVSSRDFPLVEASVLIFSVWIVLANLAVDVIYPFLDPRIRR